MNRSLGFRVTTLRKCKYDFVDVENVVKLVIDGGDITFDSFVNNIDEIVVENYKDK